MLLACKVRCETGRGTEPTVSWIPRKNISAPSLPWAMQLTPWPSSTLIQETTPAWSGGPVDTQSALCFGCLHQQPHRARRAAYQSA